MTDERKQQIRERAEKIAGPLHDEIHEAAALIDAHTRVEIGWAPEDSIPMLADALEAFALSVVSEEQQALDTIAILVGPELMKSHPPNSNPSDVIDGVKQRLAEVDTLTARVGELEQRDSLRQKWANLAVSLASHGKYDCDWMFEQLAACNKLEHDKRVECELKQAHAEIVAESAERHVSELREDVHELCEVVSAIGAALDDTREDSTGWNRLRGYLDSKGVYHDNLQSEAVIVEVCSVALIDSRRAALTPAAPAEQPTKGDHHE
jgi:hypothetical protein